MISLARQRVFIALCLMAVLFLGGAVSAEAADTNGSDRMVKGAAAGAAIGAVTQVVRGRTRGVELLKGAAVGASVGAAAGAYSDYKQEKDARRDAERRADYYQYDNRSYRNSGRAYRANSFANQNRRAARRAHNHNGRCRH